MEAYPALSIQRSSGEQLSNMGMSEIRSSSFPVLPPLLEKYPPGAAQLASNSEVVGHIVSSAAGFSTVLHSSSASTHERHLSNTPSISKLSDIGTSSPLALSHSESFHSTSSGYFTKEKNDVSLFADMLQDVLDYPENIPVQNCGVDISSAGGGGVTSEEQTKQSDWQEWADQLIITDDENLASGWSELLVDTNFVNPELKPPQPSSNSSLHQSQTHQQLPVQSGESGADASPFSSVSGAPTKPRMRWTPELHDCFVEAVNQLGGSERATPKGVLKLMKVEGLTIYHVKSHLQKYRTARYIPDPSEVTSEKKMTGIEGLPSLGLKTGIEITEALRLQIEVQKKLHEQLEIQRNLQLRIEEQGRYLQTMFEKQSSSGSDMLKASSLSTLDDPSALSLDLMMQHSAPKNESEVSEKGHPATENDIIDANAKRGETSWKMEEKQKPSEIQPTEVPESDAHGRSISPPKKRAKEDDASQPKCTISVSD